jgi:predicted HTH transcriptional regulator
LNNVDAILAGQELRTLVEEGLIEQRGIGRWTQYLLEVSPQLPEQIEPRTDEDRVISFVIDKGSITNAECRELVGSEDYQVYYLLKKLVDDDRLKPEGKGRWRRYVLP